MAQCPVVTSTTPDPGATPARPAGRRVVGWGGLELAVWEQGPAEAPTVVLVHGYPDTHAVWDLVVERLLADHHVVTYDVRGAGASGVPEDRAGYRMAALVADLVAVADATSPDRPVHLVAHDWGSIQSWAAVTDPTAARRIASYTSMSGPSLDHVGAWVRQRRRPGGGRWGQLGRQALHSWYIGAFQTPLAPWAWRHGLGRRWPAVLERREGVQVDDRFPGPTLVDDAVRGVELYRANLRGRVRRSSAPVPTRVPVQLLVPADDPFVTPQLLDGIEELATTLVRRDVDGRHWIPRSAPDRVARWIRSHVAEVEAGRRPAAVPTSPAAGATP